MDLQKTFTYQHPTADQVDRMTKIRGKAYELAKLIEDSCPELNSDTPTAIRKVREAVMFANASIVLEDKALRIATDNFSPVSE